MASRITQNCLCCVLNLLAGLLKTGIDPSTNTSQPGKADPTWHDDLDPSTPPLNWPPRPDWQGWGSFAGGFGLIAILLGLLAGGIVVLCIRKVVPPALET